MHTLYRRVSLLVLLGAVGVPGISALSLSPAFANGNNPGEMAKYLNPFQKKGYLNQSQDRVIKKKAFKVDALPTSQPLANRELGFFAALPKDKFTDAAYVDQLLANAKVNGVSVALPWSLLEPSEDSFNWQPIDQLLEACQRHQKTLILRVTTCGTDLPAGDKSASADTPKWVFDSGVKSLSYNTGDGVAHTMPIFWDKNYLAKWSNFVSEMADRYDKNPNLHSIGITGGGFGIGTPVVPGGDASADSGDGKRADLVATLKQNYGLTQRQIVEHWKYVADVFHKKFTTARLNFNINPPAKGRWGEDALDEIADYLVYRYGERVYLTRTGIKDGKHGFDDYRLLLKFHHDTLTGLTLSQDVNLQELPKIAKHALDDGISFAELPPAVIASSDQTVQTALDQLASHIGYQLVNQQAQISQQIGAGQPLKATFTFINTGAATAMRPERNFDKDAPMSYRVQVELRDSSGKAVLQNLHTPPTPTNQWEPGKPVTWEEELKMVDGSKRQLPAGDYSIWLSLVDSNGEQKRKIQFARATTDGKLTSGDTVEIGKLTISTAVADTKIESSSATGTPEKQQ